MASEPLAPVALLSDWLGAPIPEEGDVSRAKMLLRRASTIVIEEAGRIAHPWTPADVPAGVQQIVLSCAARGYTNPESWNYERLDDWMGGGRPVPEDGLYLTPTEKRSLALYADASRPRGIGIMRTERDVFPPVCADDGWVEYIRRNSP